MKRLFLLLALFSVVSWAACHNTGTGVYNGSGTGLSSWIGDCGGDPSSCCLYGYHGSAYGVLCSVGSRWQNSSITCEFSQNGSNFSVNYSCIWCDTQIEKDSLNCVNGGQSWQNGQCQAPCDSTHWECRTDIETSQTTVAGESVSCFSGDCFGGVYCEYVSTSTTTCTNDCGGTTTGVSEVPIRYEGACNPDNLTDEDICTGVKCTSFDGFYHLFKLCASREIVNGEQKFFPRFVGGGKGSCSANGYKESDESDFSGSSSSASDVPQECFTMGINCPARDSTNYNDEGNRSPQNDCECSKFDGLSTISRIICPDGSQTTFYGSCNDWENAHSSSSSNPPESSGSSSENPPASSGGDLAGNWTTYSQGEDIKNILGIIASKLDKEQNINNVNSVNVSLDDYEGSYSDSATISRVDSVYDPSYDIDTSGIVDAIFSRVDSTNRILDTLTNSSSVCPCFTFFQGSTTSFEHGFSPPEIQIDFSSLWGVDFCRVISVIVVAFASVVSFFIGFSIFKNISQ